MVTTKSKKTITKAVMDKQYLRDESMYNTLDMRYNIGLENTKEIRAGEIAMLRE